MVLFGLFAKYDADAMPSGSEDSDYMTTKYPMFQDTHVMIFVGFGFLMTFLKRYGYSAVSVNMLLACFTIEWSIITNGLLSEAFDRDGKFTIGLDQLLSADFSAATVLISMGAMLGKFTPVQYLIMTLIETPVALVIEHHVINTFHVNDVGDSIVVHAFGAYFGLACSKGFASKKQRAHENEGSVYHSDIFAMIGTIFLWVFWPSFNSATAEPADSRQRAVCNTFLSLCACTIVTFLVSQATDRHKKFDMVHIANSTLAGGVAIGTIANVVLHPLHALIVGVIAGFLSVLGFKYITPFLSSRVGIHDTCGVNNLHGMPGVLAGLLSAIFVVIYNPSDYGKSLNSIYPAMQSHSNTEGISAESQAVNQLIGLGMVLVSSITSGLFTGVILRLKIFNQVREKEMYADDDYFDTPADYEFTTQRFVRLQKPLKQQESLST
uniref:Ammonium_transp domain-containing protein n=1 Tax=Angiostrongylus cantonensis TaxID=6313 RepID=A0A0K0DPM2_ANGCA